MNNNKRIPGSLDRLFTEEEAKRYRGIFQPSIESWSKKIVALEGLLDDFSEGGAMRRILEKRYQGEVEDFADYIVNNVASDAEVEIDRAKKSLLACEWGVKMIDRAQEIYDGKYYLVTWWHDIPGVAKEDASERLIPLLQVEHFGGVEEALRQDLGDETKTLHFMYSKTLVDRDGNPKS